MFEEQDVRDREDEQNLIEQNLSLSLNLLLMKFLVSLQLLMLTQDRLNNVAEVELVLKTVELIISVMASKLSLIKKLPHHIDCAQSDLLNSAEMMQKFDEQVCLIDLILT